MRQEHSESALEQRIAIEKRSVIIIMIVIIQVFGRRVQSMQQLLRRMTIDLKKIVKSPASCLN